MINKFVRITVLSLTIACSAWLLPAVGSAESAVVGKPAPNFKLKDSNGVERSLSDFKGKLVVLEWLNHECPFVVKHYRSGNMQKLQSKYTVQDVIWLSINSSAPGKQGHVSGEEANELTKKKHGKATAVLLDPEGLVGKLYGAKTTPHMFVIDNAGILRYAGAIDSIPSADVGDTAAATNYVANALDQLSASKEVHPSVTAPYGCSVKY